MHAGCHFVPQAQMKSWFAVKELNLSYYIKETLLLNIYVFTYMHIYIYIYPLW